MAPRTGHLPRLLVVLLVAVWLATRCVVLTGLFGEDTAAADASTPAGPAESVSTDEPTPEPLPGMLREPAPATGAQEVPSPETGALEGRIVLADEGPVDPFRWTVRLLGPGRRWPMNAVQLQRDGRFRVAQLEPGSYRAVAEDDGMLVARVDGLVVPADDTLRDPRLLPWLVEETCREMRLHIAGEPGQRGDTSVWMLSPAGRSRGHARWVGDARILRCPQGEAPDVMVHAPGYRAQRLRWQDGRVDLDLERGLELTLQAVAPVTMAEGIRRGWCVLRPEHPLDGVAPLQLDVGFPAAALLRGEPVTLHVPAAGSYELRFAGDRSDGPGFIPLYRTVLQRGIRVDEDGAEQRVALPDPVDDTGTR